MKISLSKSTDYNLIEQVLDHGIVVQQQTFQGDVVITPNSPVQCWSSKPLDQLTAMDFIVLDDIKPEIVIIGTGQKHQMASQHLYAYFQQRQIGLETMSTLAACRTYNLLAEDQRNVVAYLIFDN